MLKVTVQTETPLIPLCRSSSENFSYIIEGCALADGRFYVPHIIPHYWREREIYGY